MAVYSSMIRIVQLGVVAAVLSIGGQGWAQERHPDTVVSGRIQLTSPGMDSGGALFSIPPHLLQQQSFTSPTFFFEGVPAVAGVGSVGTGFQMKQDLLAPLRVQWAREAETSTLRSVLGSIQLGGVAFLAIRQLSGAGTMTAKPRPVRSQRK